jgi:hypothetical protein
LFIYIQNTCMNNNLASSSGKNNQQKWICSCLISCSLVWSIHYPWWAFSHIFIWQNLSVFVFHTYPQKKLEKKQTPPRWTPCGRQISSTLTSPPPPIERVRTMPSLDLFEDLPSPPPTSSSPAGTVASEDCLDYSLRCVGYYWVLLGIISKGFISNVPKYWLGLG